ncbi:MAG: GntP family permease, partial [Mangrovibacterium sp.]
MNEIFLLGGVIFAILLLLFLVLKLKIHAFIALLIVSIVVGLISGMDFGPIIDSMKEGMGSTLGFVATVVGLGAIFGQMLESSGGAESIALYLLSKFGEKRASWALVLTGFIVAIPVFFDVGLIILIPIVYELTKQAKRSVLYYAIPLLAGLAITHSFIPPTPGPRS